MNVLILGANSDVGYACAKQFAQYEKASILLASRSMTSLEEKRKDLSIRYGTPVQTASFDICQYDTHDSFYKTIDPKPDAVVLTSGYLGNQQIAQQNFYEAKKIFETNFLGAISILEIISQDFEDRGHGTIIGIGSVAGERGRKSNYHYGAAKGALAIYLSGIRNRLAGKGINVITVLPGFIDTKMTAHLDLPEFLTATPEKVAEDIFRAFKNGKSRIYSRWYWRYIMMVIKAMPEMIFKRANL